MKYKTVIVKPTHNEKLVWSLNFVVAPEGNFLIKGDHTSCREYIKINFKAAVVRTHGYLPSHGSKGVGYWWGVGLRIRNRQDSLRKVWLETALPYQPKQTERFFIFGNKTVFAYRRLPKKWLSEWNQCL